MRVPRRYRVALQAYPGAYRRGRGPELVATLADGDDDRGRPSGREAGALAGRGLAMRAGVAVSAPGLLALAAVLLMAAALAPDTWWSDDTFIFYESAILSWSAGSPGFWWRLALAVCASCVLAVGPLKALQSSRRRKMAVLLAFPLSVAVFGALESIMVAGPDPRAMFEQLRWLPSIAFDQPLMSLGGGAAAALSVWIAFRVLAGLPPEGKNQGLAGTLIVVAASSLAVTWSRPDKPAEAALPGEYATNGFERLEPAWFLCAAGLGVALAALWRARPRRGVGIGR